MNKLKRRELPAGINYTSIGARDDYVVAAGRTRLAGARNVTVAVPGIVNDHSQLPGSEDAQREVALALAGRPPTCQSLGDMLVDTAVTDAISFVEDSVGAYLWYQGRRADKAVDKATEVPKMPPPHRRNDP
jgi:hypothetical protein